MSISRSGFSDLNDRTREIFRRLVESYLDTGEPVGSRNLSRQLPVALSPASVRNVMADLEDLGLIYAPHTSAGRLPTDRGLRFFVDACLEIGNLSDREQAEIEAKVTDSARDHTVEEMLAEASNLLSGLSRGAGVVLASKADKRLRHIEFVRLEAARALVVLVTEDGSVENRIIDVPEGMPASALAEASNYLNSQISGRSIGEVTAQIEQQRERRQAEADVLTRKLVEDGLASWAGLSDGGNKTLIVRGRANLLEDLNAVEDLDRIRMLFDELEKKNDLIQLLGLAERAEGVRIFIGSENKLFSLSGSSLIMAPYRNEAQKVVGVLGVIGPTRLNYARIVPVVDYTARLVSRLTT
ncbi:MAG: heat-inducible transcriptional repressor HrcA [Rhodobiaceae bacterium]|nr:heat-inducible transcriptional repressor HrcA [Rhodobiaceae bacterium]